jgi:hypothetical protein
MGFREPETYHRPTDLYPLTLFEGYALVVQLPKQAEQPLRLRGEMRGMIHDDVIVP